MKISNDLWFAATELSWDEFVAGGSMRFWTVSEDEAVLILAWGRPVIKTKSIARVLFGYVEDVKAARVALELGAEADARRSELLGVWLREGGTRATFEAAVRSGFISLDED